MFYKYEIKNNGTEDVLYLYLNMAFEFSKELVMDINNDEVTRRTKNFINSNDIDFEGSKVYLVIDGIVVKTLDIANIKNDTNNIKTTNIYSNDEFLITLKLDGDSYAEISLREYLLGCLANHMIINIEKETLKALCVLFRTYAYKKMDEDKCINIINDNIVYRPISYFKMIWIDNYNSIINLLNDAINETDCMFITYEDKYILPFVHLCNCGQTYFHQDYPYLKRCKSLWDLAAPYYIEIKDFTFDKFNKLLNCNINNTNNIEIIDVDYKGFVKKIKINDLVYSGEEFKNRLGLNSLNISIIVNKHYIRMICRGYGNCLGLSIYGANELAKNDCSFINILFYYFDKVKISRYTK